MFEWETKTAHTKGSGGRNVLRMPLTGASGSSAPVAWPKCGVESQNAGAESCKHHNSSGDEDSYLHEVQSRHRTPKEKWQRNSQRNWEAPLPVEIESSSDSVDTSTEENRPNTSASDSASTNHHARFHIKIRRHEKPGSEGISEIHKKKSKMPNDRSFNGNEFRRGTRWVVREGNLEARSSSVSSLRGKNCDSRPSRLQNYRFREEAESWNSGESFTEGDFRETNGASSMISSQKKDTLRSIRVIQRDLVYVVGLPASIAKKEILRRPEFFGQYGRILHIVVNRSPHTSTISTGSGAAGQTFCAYVTYATKEEAFAAVKDVSNGTFEGKVLRASFGTTKYCTYFLRGLQCTNVDCYYLHQLGPQEDSFTKEEMLSLKHQFNTKTSPIHQLPNPNVPNTHFGLGTYKEESCLTKSTSSDFTSSGDPSSSLEISGSRRHSGPSTFCEAKVPEPSSPKDQTSQKNIASRTSDPSSPKITENGGIEDSNASSSNTSSRANGSWASIAAKHRNQKTEPNLPPKATKQEAIQTLHLTDSHFPSPSCVKIQDRSINSSTVSNKPKIQPTESQCRKNSEIEDHKPAKKSFSILPEATSTVNISNNMHEENSSQKAKSFTNSQQLSPPRVTTPDQSSVEIDSQSENQSDYVVHSKVPRSHSYQARPFSNNVAENFPRIPTEEDWVDFRFDEDPFQINYQTQPPSNTRSFGKSSPLFLHKGVVPLAQLEGHLAPFAGCVFRNFWESHQSDSLHNSLPVNHEQISIPPPPNGCPSPHDLQDIQNPPTHGQEIFMNDPIYGYTDSGGLWTSEDFSFSDCSLPGAFPPDLFASSRSRISSPQNRYSDNYTYPHPEQTQTQKQVEEENQIPLEELLRKLSPSSDVAGINGGKRSLWKAAASAAGYQKEVVATFLDTYVA
eukprot:GHVP01057559.1.p1 GENE.GHVP01057559.1~~GHVP01057559.1.p1  ORF type:complete len:905 (-),score=141.23 GHVP01057559.1:119-2833(-)